MELIKATLDFESFWADDYSLSKRNTTLTKYIRDPRFKAHGVGLKIADKPTKWITHAALPELFARIPWHRVMLIGHNLKFDAAILKWIYGYSPKLLVDTKCIGRALFGNVIKDFSLNTLATVLTGETKGKELALSKNIRDLPPNIESAIAGYCIHDCDLTYEILRHLWPYFPKSEVMAMDWTIRMFTEPHLLLDKQTLLAYRQEILEEKERLLESLDHEYGKDIFTSNNKFADLLLSLGVLPPTKVSPRTGKETYAFAKTDEDLLALQEHPNPKVSLVVQARLGIKTSIGETRALSYAEHADFGAWPVDIEYCGAKQTHRYSGAKGGGGNPQNMGRGSGLRKSVRAPKGKKVVVGDSSNIELRVAMYMAGQNEAIDVIESGGDIYCWFASNLYGRQITKADELERFVGKVACLSLQYGCGKEKFRKMAGLQGVILTIEEAADIVATYRRTFYMIPRLWYTLNSAIVAMSRGESISIAPANIVSTGIDKFMLDRFKVRCPVFHLPGGLNIRYPSLRRNSNEEWVYMTRTHRKAHETKLYGGKAMENICQGLAGVIIKGQGVELVKHMPVVMQVHDELVSVADDEDVGRCADIMLRTLRTPPAWWPNIKLNAEVKFHDVYGEAK